MCDFLPAEVDESKEERNHNQTANSSSFLEFLEFTTQWMKLTN